MKPEIYKSIPSYIRNRAIEKIGKRTTTIYNAIFLQFGKIPTNLIPTIKTEIQNEIKYLKSINEKI
jgi:hypothetical protein